MDRSLDDWNAACSSACLPQAIILLRLDLFGHQRAVKRSEEGLENVFIVIHLHESIILGYTEILVYIPCYSEQICVRLLLHVEQNEVVSPALHFCIRSTHPIAYMRGRQSK